MVWLAWYRKSDTPTLKDEKNECFHAPDCPCKLPCETSACNVSCKGHHCTHYVARPDSIFRKGEPGCEPDNHPEVKEGRKKTEDSKLKHARKAAKQTSGKKKAWIDYDPADGVPANEDDAGDVQANLANLSKKDRQREIDFAHDTADLADDRAGSHSHHWDPERPHEHHVSWREHNEALSNQWKTKDESAKRFKKNLRKKQRELEKRAAAGKFCRDHRNGTCTRGDKCLWPHIDGPAAWVKEKQPTETVNTKATLEVIEEHEGKIANSPIFPLAGVSNSLGVVKRTDGKCSMNCVLAYNEILFMNHLFTEAGHDDTTEVEVTFGATSMQGPVTFSLKRSDGRVVGNDLISFKRPPTISHLPCLKMTQPEVGSHVTLLAYSFESGKPVLGASQGRVLEVVTTPGMEKAYSSASSRDGNCGAPLLNEHGRMVGWHVSAAQGKNGFIPVTKTIADNILGSGSQPLFR